MAPFYQTALMADTGQPVLDIKNVGALKQMEESDRDYISNSFSECQHFLACCFADLYIVVWNEKR